ncbi:MAG: ABC transporter substrate-binding protein [Hydrogeniiclostridium mannosilyticum]
MKMKKLLSFCLAGILALSITGCVNQHPEETSSTNESGELRLVATSPAVAQICNRLNLDLVGICESSSDLPERYDGLTTVGMAMNPDLEIIKSLNPDYILSPSSLQNDLQPKYASIGEKSLFLDLKSVEGMYASIEGLGQKFGREEEMSRYAGRI